MSAPRPPDATQEAIDNLLNFLFTLIIAMIVGGVAYQASESIWASLFVAHVFTTGYFMEKTP